jgi:2-dehydro-3-deoxyphosphogluconate aldolase / (4S)-4-hydroxy-2-oxoglutarate aldolase
MAKVVPLGEIMRAEELGAEICRIFPGESAGGPGFISAVLAPDTRGGLK